MKKLVSKVRDVYNYWNRRDGKHAREMRTSLVYVAAIHYPRNCPRATHHAIDL